MTVQLFFKMLSAFIMSIFTMIGGIFMPIEEPEVCMIGHRGYSGKYLQNTDQAFIEAAKHGSGGAETDIRMTLDGIYVTSHNSEVVLEDGTELEVAEHTYAELTAKPLKNNKTRDKLYLCTLDRYLEIMKEYNMICFIELKGDFNEEQIKEIFGICAEKYDLSKCIMQSFSFDNLIRCHELLPELPLMYTYGASESDYERCFEYGFHIDADYHVITEEMIEQFHSRGLEVGLWTANDPVALAYCKSLGVDYIESDNY